MYRFISVILAAALLAVGCGSSKKTTRRTARPPGLDTTTVARSSRWADQNFVSTQREKKAAELTEVGKQRLQKVDEFWAYLEKQDKDAVPLSSAQKANFDQAFSEGARKLGDWKKFTQNDETRKMSQTAMNYCQEAQRYLEEAIRINPFDKNARLLLATTYYNLQHIFGLQKNYTKAVEILERLIRIEKGEHALYRLLGENYAELKEYEHALGHFRKAEEVMNKTGFMAKPDTSTIFYYAFAQGDMLAHMFDARSAVAAFDKAKPFARTSQEKKDLENYTKWINWDGGNLRASEQWDKILELESQKDYNGMASACQKLLPTLQTPKAKMAVHHKLAVMEFEFLKRQDLAADRMQNVFESIPAEARIKPPDDETKAYLNTYGAMLYNLGVEARKADQKKTGLAYFTKAASFTWDNVAKAYLELVPLVWNSPEEAIKYGNLAMAANNVLTNQENCELMSLMIKANKSAGRFDEARQLFDKWKNCQQSN